MITITSSHRQTGKSVLAANLAFEFGAQQAACLLDADFAEPSQHIYFALDNAPASISALCRLIEQDRLSDGDFEKLTLDLLIPEAKVTLLAGTSNFANSGRITQDSFETLVEFINLRYREVIVDLTAQPENASEKEQFLLDRSLRTLVTCNADQVSISRFIANLENLSQSVDFEKTTLIMNRVRSGVLGANPENQLTATIANHTPFKEIFFVPEDPVFDKAMLQSVPLRSIAKKSPALVAVQEIAKSLISLQTT